MLPRTFVAEHGIGEPCPMQADHDIYAHIPPQLLPHSARKIIHHLHLHPRPGKGREERRNVREVPVAPRRRRAVDKHRPQRGPIPTPPRQIAVTAAVRVQVIVTRQMAVTTTGKRAFGARQNPEQVGLRVGQQARAIPAVQVVVLDQEVAESGGGLLLHFNIGVV